MDIVSLILRFKKLKLLSRKIEHQIDRKLKKKFLKFTDENGKKRVLKRSTFQSFLDHKYSIEIVNAQVEIFPHHPINNNDDENHKVQVQFIKLSAENEERENFGMNVRYLNKLVFTFLGIFYSDNNRIFMEITSRFFLFRICGRMS